MNLVEVKKEMLSKGIRLNETYYINGEDNSLVVSVEAVHYGAIVTSEQSAEYMENEEQAVEVYQNLYDLLKVNIDYDESKSRFEKVGYKSPTSEDSNE